MLQKKQLAMDKFVVKGQKRKVYDHSESDSKRAATSERDSDSDEDDDDAQQQPTLQ